MEKEFICYEFVNSQTGNVIAYLSLKAGLSKEDQHQQLEKKKASLAISNKIYIALIFWQEQGHGIRLP
ncbi:hypothetical protein [Mucilaginibacter sp.]|uniref:hypothetical protein n=1 Tax=Mucilaginibacter sp. TaxID=1882438 RepID=UPI00374CB6EE